ncbi:MFS transporter [Halovivax limisalsi]|uniref:MFS transporter n=1 Tax=Halovivax limisalsi TaxID=1453760 RepID=UPI001FFCD446|nr:MFS transporter [Halovivax limisalsi]
MGRVPFSEWLAVANPRRVGLISGAHAMNEFFSVALPPILPLLVAEFQFDYAAAGFLLTVFFAAYSICQLPVGIVADRVGKRPLIAVSTIGLVVGVLIASQADSYAQLVVAQLVSGVSGSAYHPAGMALISDIESGDTEGRAMGIHGLGGIVGVALAPVVIGGVSELSTWRTALIAAGGLGVVFTAVFLLWYPDREDAEAAEERSDSGDRVEPDGAGGVETRSWVALLGQPATLKFVILLFAMHALVSAEIRALHSFTTAFAYGRTSDSTLAANVVFLALLLGSGVASLLAGSLSDVVDRRTLGASAGVAAAVLFSFVAIVPATLGALSAFFFAIGLVLYMKTPAMNAITAQFSDPASSGSLFGVMTTASALGGAAAPTVFGVIATEANDEVAFASIGAVSVVTVIVFLLVRRVDPDPAAR